MSITKIEKKAWRPYFDNVSRALGGKLAEIEVSSLALGNQVEADWLPLLGITYDHKSDIVEVIMEGLDHMIPHPRDIYVDVDASSLTSVEIVDEDDTRQIIKLRDPMMLSPPGKLS